MAEDNASSVLALMLLTAHQGSHCTSVMSLGMRDTEGI